MWSFSFPKFSCMKLSHYRPKFVLFVTTFFERGGGVFKIKHVRIRWELDQKRTDAYKGEGVRNSDFLRTYFVNAPFRLFVGTKNAFRNRIVYGPIIQVNYRWIYINYQKYPDWNKRETFRSQMIKMAFSVVVVTVTDWKCKKIITLSYKLPIGILPFKFRKLKNRICWCSSFVRIIGLQRLGLI